MKLSKAITKGYEHPDIIHTMGVTVAIDEEGRICACPLAAATVGCGVSVDDLRRMRLGDVTLYLRENGIDISMEPIEAPEGFFEGFDTYFGNITYLQNLVIGLNDRLKWSWQEIAAYLERHGY